MKAILFGLDTLKFTLLILIVVTACELAYHVAIVDGFGECNHYASE
jgi:hypothetical protein